MALKRPTTTSYVRVMFVVLAYAIACFGSATIICQTPPKRDSEYRPFVSLVELKDFLVTRKTESRSILDYTFPALAGAMTKQVAFGDGEVASMPYSRTNIQVEGVDEADIVKTDGRYVYLLSGQNLLIVKAYPPNKPEILSKLKLVNRPVGLFVAGNRLVVLLSDMGYLGRYCESDRYPSMTWIEIFDIEDPSSPRLASFLNVTGQYLDSRLIEDYVYVITTSPAYLSIGKNGNISLPRISRNGSTSEIPVTDINYCPDDQDISYSFTVILSVGIRSLPEDTSCKVALTGSATTIYVSRDNIYLAIPSYMTGISSSPKLRYTGESGQFTFINRIGIGRKGIAFEASGKVPGYLLNQFSVDEYQGFLRLATTTGHLSRNSEEASSRNNLYVLRMEDLVVVGRLEGLAIGEKIYSARFMGSRCYVVTFRKVDPLFVIDISNPNIPTVLGELKIPGYSDYLHPYGESHLLGIGKDAVPAEQGDFSWYQGIKISLFDVTDLSNPIEISKSLIGDRGTWSPILEDHKAFLLDEERGLLVIPIMLAIIDRSKFPNGAPPYAFGDIVFQGAYVFDLSGDGGLIRKGEITHLDRCYEATRTGYRLDSSRYIKRILYIGNHLITISDTKLVLNEIQNLTTEGELLIS